MKAQIFLKQLEKIDRQINNKIAEKEQWQLRASGITSYSEGDRVKGSGSQQKMSDAVARYVDLEMEIDHCIDRLIDTRKDILNVIEQLKLDEYDVLHKVYVQYLDYKEVARLMNKSYSSVTTTHCRALQSVQKILDERGSENGSISTK